MLEKGDCPLLGRRLWRESLVMWPRFSSETPSAAAKDYFIPTVRQDVCVVLGLDRKHVFLPYMLLLMMLAKHWEKCRPDLPTSSVANPWYQTIIMAFGGQHNMCKYAWLYFDFSQLPHRSVAASAWSLLCLPHVSTSGTSPSFMYACTSVVHCQSAPTLIQNWSGAWLHPTAVKPAQLAPHDSSPPFLGHSGIHITKWFNLVQ